MPDYLNKFTFPEEFKIKRIPSRPPQLQIHDFHDKFDYNTLWNDAVRVAANTILLIGPSLNNAVEFIQKYCNFVSDKDQILDWTHIQLDRVSILVITVPSVISELYIVFEEHKWKINWEEQSPVFNNKITAITISKNNEISWIKQWLEYHRKVHNLDGLVIYNNQSTLYTSEQLEQAIKRPDMEIKVVDYDVPYGPQGCGDWEWKGMRGSSLPWDSDFAQYVMMEHAKWKYLTRSRLVISIDFDELLMTGQNTLQQIADYCQTSENFAIAYEGIWIEPVNSKSMINAKDVELSERKFSDYFSTAKQVHAGIPIKHMLCPNRTLKYQWLIHGINGPHIKTDSISYGHYMAMNTGWSWTRDSYNLDPQLLQIVTELKNNLDKTWNSL